MRHLQYFALAAIILLTMATVSWLPQEVSSQVPTGTTNYIFVTLDEFSVISPQTLLPNLSPARLMLGAVSASGNRVQKVLWPSQIWSEGIISAGFLSEDRDAIPLFALPEDQLGEELGFALVVLNNTIPADQHPENWLNNGLSPVVEAVAEPVSLWITGQPIARDIEGTITESIRPQLAQNELRGVIAAKFTKNQDWGVSDQIHEAENFDLFIKYRIQRVNVLQEAKVDVRLRGISLERSDTFAGTWKGTDPEDGSIVTLSLRQTQNLLEGLYADTFSPGNPPIAPGFSGSGTGERNSATEAFMNFDLHRPDGVRLKVDKVRLSLSNQGNTLTMSDFVVNGQPFPQQRPIVMQRQPVELFTWTRVASGFGGEGLNGLIRRLPFGQTYILKAGESKTLDEVIYSGDLDTFLYVELGVWDQRTEGPMSLGTLSELWTIANLTQAASGVFNVTVQGPGEGPITLTLAIEARGLAQTFSLGAPLEIGVGQTAINPDTNLQITFLTVLSDSRCPTGVQCVWAGEASVLIGVTLAGETTELQGTIPRRPPEPQVQEFTIQLFALAPYPHIEVAINPEAYRLTLQVDRNLAQTLRVPQDFATIQAAIDAASEGDTIQVQAGVYRENVTFQGRRNLTLQGAGRDQVTLDGSAGVGDQKPGIFVENSQHITVQGLRVINSRQALHAVDVNDLILSNNRLENNVGVGVLLERAHAELSDLTVIQTKADPDGINGYGVLLQGASQATLDNCTINNNEGLGIFLGGNSNATIQNSTFSENNLQGIALVDTSSVTLENSTVKDNGDSGISLFKNSTATLKNTEISGNTRAGIGMQDSAQAIIQNNTLSRNPLGGILLFQAVEAHILDNTITDNKDWGIWAQQLSNIVECRGNTARGNGTNYNDVAQRKCT